MFLVNLASAGHQPAHVDCSSITAADVAANGEITLYTAQGQLRQVHKNLDLPTLRAALETTGRNFLITGADRFGAPITTLICPDDIKYAAAQEADDNGMINALISIQGHDLRASLTQDNWRRVLSTMQNSSRPLMTYDQAYTRATNTQTLYIYPDAITVIEGTGQPGEIAVYFEGRALKGLNIQLFPENWLVSRISDLRQQWIRQQDPLTLNSDNKNAAHTMIIRQANQEMLSQALHFARGLADAHGDLMFIQSGLGQSPLYVRRDQVLATTLGSEPGFRREERLFSLRVTVSPLSRQAVPNMIFMLFNTCAERDTAHADMQRQLAAPAKTSTGTKPGPK